MATPYTISIPQAEIDDLKQRLSNARIPECLDGENEGSFFQGTEFLGTISFDLSPTGRMKFPHFTMPIQDETIHFIHQRSSRPDARPLILSHGWPGSFLEFHKMIVPLAEPGDESLPAFHVVVPSLPGFGFSSKPQKKGFKLTDIASIFVELMDKLGYPEFFAQGGDWGSGVTRTLALEYPARCKAIHLNLCFAPIPTDPSYRLKRFLLSINPSWILSREDLESLEMGHQWNRTESAYYKIQSSKPYTLGVGLNDSPVGLAAWIGEKMRAGFHVKGGQRIPKITKDEILTNISIYWFTQTITSSFRLYKEEKFLSRVFEPRVNQPVGIAIFPVEISKPPREWLQYNHNLKRYTKMPSGGHFAAFEEPELMLQDVRAFFKQVESDPTAHFRKAAKL
ncbi:hypothetical protein HDU76_005688 [Blyttiomyces sp. JEL0837]|nr:hypothetical protein HDU76_005688 [Blyttiomyces sp. JEL0837]